MNGLLHAITNKSFPWSFITILKVHLIIHVWRLSRTMWSLVGAILVKWCIKDKETKLDSVILNSLLSLRDKLNTLPHLPKKKKKSIQHVTTQFKQFSFTLPKGILSRVQSSKLRRSLAIKGKIVHNVDRRKLEMDRFMFATKEGKSGAKLSNHI